MAAPFNVERLVLGFSLLALGVLWTLANLGHLDLLAILRRWWPIVLVFWGALELGLSLYRRPARRGGSQ